jgi:hypothetical protein
MHGQSWEYKPLPKRFKPRLPGYCFQNAAQLANRCKDLIYVEGYAIWRSGPLHHAWCADRDGKVIDNTWYDPTRMDNGRVYFGVPFRTEYVLQMRRESKMYSVLDNWMMDFPLLSGKHPQILWKAMVS